ncbi:MAG: hypothetical protein ACOX02_04300 [Acholeplasmatales bacterium]
MREIIEIGNHILNILKYIVPVFLLLIALFFTLGLFRTYFKATNAVRELSARPSSFIIWIIIGVALLFVWFKWVVPILPF